MVEAADVDALFRLLLDKFTASRNALTAGLKRGGQTKDSLWIRRLARLSVLASVVNQLCSYHRQAFGWLLVTSARFKKASASHCASKTAYLCAPLVAQ